jgi:hypothetical protein
MTIKLVFYLSFLLVTSCTIRSKEVRKAKLLKMEVHLSAFAVESDHFPDINGFVDFTSDSSYFYKSYYNPAYKASTYSLSSEAFDSLRILISQTSFSRIDTLYKFPALDMPSSTITFVWDDKKFKTEDYGLRGAPELEKIYRLIYKL